MIAIYGDAMAKKAFFQADRFIETDGKCIDLKEGSMAIGPITPLSAIMIRLPAWARAKTESSSPSTSRRTN